MYKTIILYKPTRYPKMNTLFLFFNPYFKMQNNSIKNLKIYQINQW